MSANQHNNHPKLVRNQTTKMANNTKQPPLQQQQQKQQSKLIKKAYVKFDDYLDLNEENMRRSCKRLMNRLYSEPGSSTTPKTSAANNKNNQKATPALASSSPPPPVQSTSTLTQPTGATKQGPGAGPMTTSRGTSGDQSTSTSSLVVPNGQSSRKSYLRSQYERRQERQLSLMNKIRDQQQERQQPDLIMEDASQYNHQPDDFENGGGASNNNCQKLQRSSDQQLHQQDLVAKSHELSKRRFFEKLERRESMKNTHLSTQIQAEIRQQTKQIMSASEISEESLLDSDGQHQHQQEPLKQQVKCILNDNENKLKTPLPLEDSDRRRRHHHHRQSVASSVPLVRNVSRLGEQQQHQQEKDTHGGLSGPNGHAHVDHFGDPLPPIVLGAGLNGFGDAKELIGFHTPSPQLQIVSMPAATAAAAASSTLESQDGGTLNELPPIEPFSHLVPKNGFILDANGQVLSGVVGGAKIAALPQDTTNESPFEIKVSASQLNSSPIVLMNPKARNGFISSGLLVVKQLTGGEQTNNRICQHHHHHQQQQQQQLQTQVKSGADSSENLGIELDLPDDHASGRHPNAQKTSNESNKSLTRDKAPLVDEFSRAIMMIGASQSAASLKNIDNQENAHKGTIESAAASVDGQVKPPGQEEDGRSQVISSSISRSLSGVNEIEAKSLVDTAEVDEMNKTTAASPLNAAKEETTQKPAAATTTTGEVVGFESPSSSSSDCLSPGKTMAPMKKISVQTGGKEDEGIDVASVGASNRISYRGESSEMKTTTTTTTTATSGLVVGQSGGAGQDQIDNLNSLNSKEQQTKQHHSSRCDSATVATHPVRKESTAQRESGSQQQQQQQQQQQVAHNHDDDVVSAARKDGDCESADEAAAASLETIITNKMAIRDTPPEANGAANQRAQVGRRRVSRTETSSAPPTDVVANGRCSEKLDGQCAGDSHNIEKCTFKYKEMREEEGDADADADEAQVEDDGHDSSLLLLKQRQVMEQEPERRNSKSFSHNHHHHHHQQHQKSYIQSNQREQGLILNDVSAGPVVVSGGAACFQYANPSLKRLDNAGCPGQPMDSVNHDHGHVNVCKRPLAMSDITSSENMETTAQSNVHLIDKYEAAAAAANDDLDGERRARGQYSGEGVDQQRQPPESTKINSTTGSQQTSPRMGSAAAAEEDRGSSCSSSGFGASVGGVTSSSSSSSSSSFDSNSLRENNNILVSVNQNNYAAGQANLLAVAPTHAQIESKLYESLPSFAARLPSGGMTNRPIKEANDDDHHQQKPKYDPASDYKQLVGPDQAYPSNKSGRLSMVENHGYATLAVNHCQIRMAPPLPLSSLYDYGRHDGARELDISSGQYENLPRSKQNNNQNSADLLCQTNIVEYATVRAAKDEKVIAGVESSSSSIGFNISNNNSSHNQGNNSLSSEEASLSGLSYSASSANSGGFSRLPPVRIVGDCPSSNIFDSHAAGELRAFEPANSLSSAQQQQQQQQVRKSSLLKRFGSLVSKAFTSTNGGPQSITAAAATTTTTTTSRMLNESPSAPSKSEGQAPYEVAQHEPYDNSSIAAASKPALVIERNHQVVAQEGHSAAAATSGGAYQRPVAINEADLVILPAKNRRKQAPEEYKASLAISRRPKLCSSTQPQKQTALNGTLPRVRADHTDRLSRSKHRRRCSRKFKRSDTSSLTSSLSSISSSKTSSSFSRSSVSSLPSLLLAGSSSLSISSHRSSYKRHRSRKGRRQQQQQQQQQHNRKPHHIHRHQNKRHQQEQKHHKQHPARASSLSDELESLMASKRFGGPDADVAPYSCRDKSDSSARDRATASSGARGPKAKQAGEASNDKASNRLQSSKWGGRMIDIDCVSPTQQALDDMDQQSTTTSGRRSAHSRSLLRWFSATGSQSTSGGGGQRLPTDTTNSVDADQPRASKNENHRHHYEMERSNDQQLISGFWGFSSLIEQSHAKTGSKNSNNDKPLATKQQQRQQQRSNKSLIKQKGSQAAATLDDLSSLNMYSSAARTPRHGDDVDGRHGRVEAAPADDDDDNDDQARKCQSLNLYQNILRNYIKRRSDGHDTHHHSHHHHHHHHNHNRGHPHHHAHHHHHNHHHKARNPTGYHAHPYSSRCGQPGCSATSQPCLKYSASGEHLAPVPARSNPKLAGAPELAATVWGQLIKINKSDGSQVIELHRAAGKSWGFFVARGAINNVRGIFISRMQDNSASHSLTGLLGIGDRIMAIDDCPIEPDYDILRVNQMISKKSKILLKVKPFKG